MILYFTGTGNSRYLANKLSLILGDEVVSLNALLKEGKKNEKFFSDKPFVFVLPVYFGKIPNLIEDFIKASSFSGSSIFYFIPNYYNKPFNTAKYLNDLTKGINKEYYGSYYIRMPNGHTTLSSGSSLDEAKKIIDAADKELITASSYIKDNRQFEPLPDKGNFVSTVVNKFFYKHLASSKNFNVNNDCIGCGKCKDNCPTNNITIENSKPVFHSSCINCMSCINQCNKKAINYKNKTKKFTRFYNNF